MKVYRITLSKWAKSLNGSGYPARWNSKGKFVVYCAGSIALAILENLAYRSGEGLIKNFKVVTLEIPDKVKLKKLTLEKLPKLWYKVQNYELSQKVGDEWIEKSDCAVLEIPSSIVPNEKNYILNLNHKDFSLIKIKSVADFEFDPRIKH